MSQVNFRIDDDVKTDAEALFNRLGMNMSTAIMVFIRQSLAENGIPFRIQAAPQVSDRERFVQAGIDYENGKVNYHYHDLPEMEENRPRRTFGTDGKMDKTRLRPDRRFASTVDVS